METMCSIRGVTLRKSSKDENWSMLQRGTTQWI